MDYSIYNNSMSKSMGEKLFFIDLVEFDTLVDFGCADGSIIAELAPLFPKKRFIGYDYNTEMIKLAQEKNLMYDNVLFFDDMHEISNTHGVTLLLLSSILHEIYTFEQTDSLLDIIGLVNPKYIAIRDMYCNMESFLSDKIRLSIKGIAMGDGLIDPESLILDSQRLEYLLKRRYLNGHNSGRERSENYMAYAENANFLNWNAGKCIYRRDYCPEFFKNQFSEMFGEQWDYITHTQRIYRRY